ncbi:hypothetical protein BX666DRAFT_1976171 [Dichotomocladium elegans]|nr:hypothetical protein BX666DRAFT_1976171 [Dichotomocladium elegans]
MLPCPFPLKKTDRRALTGLRMRFHSIRVKSHDVRQTYSQQNILILSSSRFRQGPKEMVYHHPLHTHHLQRGKRQDYAHVIFHHYV